MSWNFPRNIISGGDWFLFDHACVFVRRIYCYIVLIVKVKHETNHKEENSKDENKQRENTESEAVLNHRRCLMIFLLSSKTDLRFLLIQICLFSAMYILMILFCSKKSWYLTNSTRTWIMTVAAGIKRQKNIHMSIIVSPTGPILFIKLICIVIRTSISVRFTAMDASNCSYGKFRKWP